MVVGYTVTFGKFLMIYTVLFEKINGKVTIFSIFVTN